MLIFLRKKAQSTAEYAIILGVVIAAAIAMQTYVKRSMQAGVKFAVDNAAKTGGTGQYEPYYLQSNYQTKTSAYKDTEKTSVGGGVDREIGVGGDKTITRTGGQTVADTTKAD